MQLCLFLCPNFSRTITCCLWWTAENSGFLYSRLTKKAWFKPNAVLNIKELAEFLQQAKVQLCLKHMVVQLILIANSRIPKKYRMFIQADKEQEMFASESSKRISWARIFFSCPAIHLLFCASPYRLHNLSARFNTNMRARKKLPRVQMNACLPAHFTVIKTIWDFFFFFFCWCQKSTVTM